MSEGGISSSVAIREDLTRLVCGDLPGRRAGPLYRAVLAGDAAGRRGAAISREDFAFLLE